MSTEAAVTLLAQILRLWARDAATCDQERHALARFLGMPEERVGSLALLHGRNYPAVRPGARTATSRHTFAVRTPRTR